LKICPKCVISEELNSEVIFFLKLKIPPSTSARYTLYLTINKQISGEIQHVFFSGTYGILLKVLLDVVYEMLQYFVEFLFIL